MRVINALIKFLLGLASPFIWRFERSKIKYQASIGERFQPIFIVGAPRTGSTILYQILTNTFDLAYIDNLTSKFYRNIYFGFWLSNKLLCEKPHNYFESKHGKTTYGGLRSPSECGEFWYRWLPRDHHYIGKEEVSETSLEEIRNNIFSIINKYNKPLLFKNLNAGQRMGFINEIAPRSKIIFITRDPQFTAQSILLCRENLGINPNEFWSIRPYNYKELIKYNEIRMVVKQIFYLEKQIIKDKALFQNDNFLQITFEELNHNLDKTMSKIHSFLGHDLQKRKASALPHLNFIEQQNISDKKFNSIKTEIQNFDWTNYEHKLTDKDISLINDC